YGGADAGLAAMCVVLDGLGWHTAPGPFLGSSVLAVTALAGARDETLRARWLPRIARGEVAAAAAIAGAGGRVAPDLVNVSLSRHGSTRHMSGTAALVLNGADADLLVVATRAP